MADVIRPQGFRKGDLDAAQGEVLASREVAGAPGDIVDVLLMDIGGGNPASRFIVVRDVDRESAHVPLSIAVGVAQALLDFAQASAETGRG